MWFLHDPGLLGINARNLLYIKAYNPEKAILMADNKLKTKHYLSARGIPVAKLYGVIQNKKELKEFQWSRLPQSFVIKPNSGYGGEGILIINDRTKEGNWITTDDKELMHKTLKRHINNILDGRYSLSDLADQALLEQKLEAPEWLTQMSYKGLPDVRIIVHNLIPVMAMLRLPTRASQGKANLHMGGIGVGIDIATGELTNIVQYNKIIQQIPDFGSIKGIKIPDWEELLLIASRVQQITNLGFAAIDLALDKNMGPILLEINARAGLAVQMANLAPLRRRLERIEGIHVGTPEKGVRIALDIFGKKAERKMPAENKKTVVGSFEPVELIGCEGNITITAKIDPHAAKSTLDAELAQEKGILEAGKCKFNLLGKRVTTVVETADFGQQDFKMVIGKRDLREFWVDPNKIQPKKAPGVARSSAAVLRVLDQELVILDKQIHLLAHLRPINWAEEKEIVLADPTYNPHFQYKPLSFDPVELKRRLEYLDFPKEPLGILLKKKAKEIQQKVELLEARGSESFTDYSKALIPPPDDDTVNLALAQVKAMPKTFPVEASIPTEEVKKRFERALVAVGLTGWEVLIKEGLTADVIAGKEKTILLSAEAPFTENRLRGTLVHEIETHVFTAMNGARQPYKIFQRGLAGYLTTQEGLAVYNQERTEAMETQKKYWPASSIIGIDASLRGGFTEVVTTLRQHGFDAERALKVALKTKRGLADTSKAGGFTKDAVYIRGKQLILSFLQQGGNLKDLYIGKINVEDLPLVKKIKGLKQPLYLPEYLKTVA
ncbi:MAG: tyrosine/phenylalanine carboxypeptidase domain-containing protein [Candidatus Peregrinibacteria bacterium]